MSTSTGTIGTILLAEGDTGQRGVLELVLSAHNYEVVTTATGPEALAYLRDHTPSLIMADSRLPILSGLEVCDRVKRVSRLKNVPFVIMADFKDEEAQQEARRVRADRVVTRPFIGKDLGRIVFELIRSPNFQEQ
jgi:CheY-like chemotaxis protein